MMNTFLFKNKLIKSLFVVYALCSLETVYAENWFSLGEDPQGETMNPPAQLEKHPIANNAEKHLPPNKEFTLWIQDETLFRPKEDDKVEVKKVLEKEVKTHKLEGKVPDIAFKSGDINIPESYIERLRDILIEMKNRTNVRLHFIGHSDSDKLGPGLTAKYINNVGLSKFRAQETAEYFQHELDLPPDGVSFDGVGDTKPIASNKTEAGKRKNRRVEVQVWYDEVTEKAVDKEFIIAANNLNRLKVCRKETVCKITYKEGSARRARLQHLVKALRTEAGEAGIPNEFIRQIRETQQNLSDKKNLVLRFVGHTDNLPLADAESRIYGDHVNLSKARARYVALEVQGILSLQNTQVSSSGKGLKFPIASNGTERGRSFNRRVEVEFWYDDPFEQLSGEPQACPEAAGSETVTLTYDPPTGPIKAIRFKDGQPVIPKGYSERLSNIFNDAGDKANLRLSFVGYTNNERMDRRAAMVYGDDIGLSTSRARRAMEVIKEEMKLTDEQVEHEGHGYVHSDDVVSTGFIQFDSSRVEVKILYDELTMFGDQENLEILLHLPKAEALVACICGVFSCRLHHLYLERNP